MPPFPNLNVSEDATFDLGPTYMNFNSDHLLIWDYLPTTCKLEVCEVKRS